MILTDRPRRREIAKPGSQVLALAVLAVAFSGCAAIDQAREAQAQQDLAGARQSCARFTDGTPAFATCVETELAVISYQRRRALEEQSAPGRVPSYGPRGQFCVPTAAGSTVAC